MRKWISHNQGICVGLVLVVVLVVWTYGCESKVTSPVSGKQVNREQLHNEVKHEITRLQLEVEKLSDTATVALSTLDKQDAMKQRLFEAASMLTTTNAINPTGLIGIAGILLGTGLAVDNRIKDKVIKNRPLKQPLPIKVT